MCLFFLVSDGEHTSPEMALNIHLLPIEELPPSFQVTAPVLEVTPGGSTSVGESWGSKSNIGNGFENGTIFYQQFLADF